LWLVQYVIFESIGKKIVKKSRRLTNFCVKRLACAKNTLSQNNAKISSNSYTHSKIDKLIIVKENPIKAGSQQEASFHKSGTKRKNL
jgi:hypothetical protein